MKFSLRFLPVEKKWQGVKVKSYLLQLGGSNLYINERFFFLILMNSKEVSQMLEIFKVHTGGAAKLWSSILNQAMQILLMTVIGRDW